MGESYIQYWTNDLSYMSQVFLFCFFSFSSTEIPRSEVVGFVLIIKYNMSNFFFAKIIEIKKCSIEKQVDQLIQ